MEQEIKDPKELEELQELQVLFNDLMNLSCIVDEFDTKKIKTFINKAFYRIDHIYSGRLVPTEFEVSYTINILDTVINHTIRYYHYDTDISWLIVTLIWLYYTKKLKRKTIPKIELIQRLSTNEFID